MFWIYENVIRTDKTIAEPVRKLALKWAKNFWEAK